MHHISWFCVIFFVQYKESKIRVKHYIITCLLGIIPKSYFNYTDFKIVFRLGIICLFYWQKIDQIKKRRKIVRNQKVQITPHKNMYGLNINQRITETYRIERNFHTCDPLAHIISRAILPLCIHVLHVFFVWIIASNTETTFQHRFWFDIQNSDKG